MLKIEQCVFVLVDVQEKLTAFMHEREELVRHLVTAVRGLRALQVPVLWMEQTPDKLGPTITPLQECLTGLQPLPKVSFSCAGEPAFRQALQATHRRQVLLAGIETHVCVYQTAAHLLQDCFEVHVLADAVSSRSRLNREIGLERMRGAGARLTSVETVLFELLQTSAHPAFRDILKIVR